LLEQITRQLREPDEAELSAMASDPEIQAELGAIDRKFALAEMDGLHWMPVGFLSNPQVFFQVRK
jgi:hypothetical protein